MGTLSTNRSAIVVVTSDQAWVDYTVDFAEVPSAAEEARLDADPDGYADRRMAELLPQIHLAVDGAERPLSAEGCSASTGSGEGGLPTVLLECRLRADPVEQGTLELRDDNFAGTVGWREIRFAGDGVAIGGPDAVAGPPPLPFRTPPEQMTRSRATATLGAAPEATPSPPPVRSTDGFADLVGGALSPRFVALALLSAAGLGAGHALTPGHGKALVGAYLVGSRGTVAQAVLLGLVVTLTHVSSVLLLGAVTLWLSQYVVAAALYPWIGVASGLGVVAIGAGLLRSRTRPHDHEHVVRDERGEPVGLGRLLALGVTGGSVPCPSALVVLLSATALHRIAFGLALIVAFSAGLAGVLVAIGVLVVRARGLLERLSGVRAAGAWVPVASAVVVIGLGLAIAWQAAVEGGL